ncbi:hypothetical protein [Xanthomonas phaseoli]|uniref:hypothetical protein n=1 Tax=Xanthomonas phaseoli TaxID=1985254 RepID=UPI00031CB8C5|nr:hypothetical protein [Xanthomonas phaseoli]MBO9757839.1 hypothetical protein [Xanthomonas phaseoli pv. manihotis]MBO9765438.1 hypothetical protein [Xanthomonas phaseoli pv. manihotis]UEQ16246.1 hypothetical protein K9838_06290 [Xanthomonas phaseoli pv. manihotis]
MPAQVLVVAFPTAYKQYPQSQPADTHCFFLVQANATQVRIASYDTRWLLLEDPSPIATGLTKINYRATDITLARRQVTVPIQVNGTPYEVEFVQQAGRLVQIQMVQVLNCPLNLECLIAVIFIANLIEKIPLPPIKLLVALIAALALAALGVIVALIRRSFADAPEPKPLSNETNGVPIVLFPGMSLPNGLPLKTVRAESQTIALQTVREIYWLVKQVTES